MRHTRSSSPSTEWLVIPFGNPGGIKTQLFFDAFQEERDLASGHDTANFVWKCGSCKRESSAKFDRIDKKTIIKPYELAESEAQKFALLAAIDCRGLEFIGFEPRVRHTGRSAEVSKVLNSVIGRLEVRGG